MAPIQLPNMNITGAVFCENQRGGPNGPLVVSQRESTRDHSPINRLLLLSRVLRGGDRAEVHSQRLSMI